MSEELSTELPLPLLLRTQVRPQSGKVVSLNTTSRTATIDVGVYDTDGNPQYLAGMPYQPQSPPTVGDNVAIAYSDLTPYSAKIGRAHV